MFKHKNAEDILKEWEKNLKIKLAKQEINREAYIAYSNNSLNEWIISLIDTFGLDVLKSILASTIARAKNDKRYSQKNREWALSYHDLHKDDTLYLLQISPIIINEITNKILL